jgi:hypothetical protein
MLQSGADAELSLRSWLDAKSWGARFAAHD